ncbi:MAG TPA: hypothetical protein VKP30_24140 [Polyangiaceae bacterium]|nr:hypothetical protein [Polyangiaceae bacterium]
MSYREPMVLSRYQAIQPGLPGVPGPAVPEPPGPDVPAPGPDGPEPIDPSPYPDYEDTPPVSPIDVSVRARPPRSRAARLEAAAPQQTNTVDAFIGDVAVGSLVAAPTCRGSNRADVIECACVDRQEAMTTSRLRH